MNERETEKLTRRILVENNFDPKDFIIEEQQSKNPTIQRLLSTASKNMTENRGYPEFIIQDKKIKDLIYVIECKASIKDHSSLDYSNPKKMAVDGAIHYAKSLSKEFNVVAIGISGKEENFKLNQYLLKKGSKDPEHENRGSKTSIIKPNEALNIINDWGKQAEKNMRHLQKHTIGIHNILRDSLKISDEQKPVLISMILLALKNHEFRFIYKQQQNDKEVFKVMERAVNDELSLLEGFDKNERIDVINSFLKQMKTNKNITNLNKMHLKEVIHTIDNDIWPNLKFNDSQDFIGEFYKEFLKYTDGNKKGLGIVLTPRHVTELFADLAEVNEESIVLDPATGTGGFLMGAMKKMFSKTNDNKKISEIKRSQLLGIEADPKMFSLATINMILRGDGYSNIFYESCFDTELKKKIKKMGPTVGMINPPYSQKDYSELEFVYNMLDMLSKGGIGIAIIPISNLISKAQLKMKKEILSKHTLLGSISMPNQLFYPVGTITNIVIFKANIPHPKDFKTWFCLGKDDGFTVKRHIGRVFKKGDKDSWESVKQIWVNSYLNKTEIPGLTVLKDVSYNDEWSVEEYITPDFTKVSVKEFEKTYASLKIAELLEKI